MRESQYNLWLEREATCQALHDRRLTDVQVGLDKCWDTVGNPSDVIGDIRDYRNRNGGLAKRLAYDPFAKHENRCGTFRHTYLEPVDHFVRAAREPAPVAVAIGAPPAIRRLETR